MREIKFHPGVPPPTTDPNKGGSVPVIWKKSRHGAYLEYTQNIVLQHLDEDPAVGNVGWLTGTLDGEIGGRYKLRNEISVFRQRPVVEVGWESVNNDDRSGTPSKSQADDSVQEKH
ncbi:hypothetical protein TNCV_324161 [Trichonephila clavipes]|nr:hypothetical protein TNCV_324161 [Trichonephila clavipes]